MSWIAVGVGVVGMVGGMVSRGKSNRKMKKLQAEAEANRYVANPLAQKRLDLANTLLNARMPGASGAEKNIYTGGANALAKTQRNATDSNQLLLSGAAIQGQQNEDFTNLAQMENQDYQRRYGNQVAAQEGVIEEGNKVQMGKQAVLQQKAQLQGAQAANTAANWSSISNLGFSAANFGMNGGFSSGMGQKFWGSGGGGGGSQYMQRTAQYNPQMLPYRNG